jgi:hypothetical protein
MASGYESIHPRTKILFQELGIPSDDVIQGWGSAAASAGTHDIVGTYQGTAFGSCCDLPHDTYSTRDWIDRLIGASICPWVRDASLGWFGGEHVHCVIPALPADDGTYPMLEIVQGQVSDFINSKSGLVGHADFPADYAGTLPERGAIAQVYWSHYSTQACQVFYPGTNIISAYAYVIGDRTTCELRPVAEALGAMVDWDTTGLHVYDHPGPGHHEINTSGWAVVVEGGFTRVPMRSVVEGLGHSLTFTPGGPNVIRIA